MINLIACLQKVARCNTLFRYTSLSWIFILHNITVLLLNLPVKHSCCCLNVSLSLSFFFPYLFFSAYLFIFSPSVMLWCVCIAFKHLSSFWKNCFIAVIGSGFLACVSYHPVHHTSSFLSDTMRNFSSSGENLPFSVAVWRQWIMKNTKCRFCYQTCPFHFRRLSCFLKPTDILFLNSVMRNCFLPLFQKLGVLFCPRIPSSERQLLLLPLLDGIESSLSDLLLVLSIVALKWKKHKWGVERPMNCLGMKYIFLYVAFYFMFFSYFQSTFCENLCHNEAVTPWE